MEKQKNLFEQEEQMKKLLGLFIAAMLVVGFAGQGMADFSDYQLIRVVYDTAYDGLGTPTGGTNEIATDLGTVSSLISGGVNQIVGGGANNFVQYSGTSWSSLRVVYFAISNSTDKDVWVSATTTPTSGNRRFTAVSSEMGQVFTNYGGESAPTTVVAAQSNANSYWKLLNDTGLGVGRLNQFFSTATSGNISEVSLASIATDGYVDQILYFFNNGDVTGTGVAVATLRTMADGSTIINYQAAAVPIPPSVLLLGAGLLGLIGIRRRTA
jgi:hypothetical protein